MAISDLREGRRNRREKVQPRHPKPEPAPAPSAEVLQELNTAGPSLPADSQDPAREVVTESPAAESENTSNNQPNEAGDAERSSEPDHVTEADPEPAAPDPEPANEGDTQDEQDTKDEGGAAPDDANNSDSNDAARELPDLDLDWTDPLNHIERNTRLSVPNSVVLRFKAVADLPGSPQYTEIMLQAVYDKLAELPELIVARRPKEQQSAGSFPFRRRSAPAAAANTDPKTALYMRPNNGEVELLARIVKWADMHIKDGHPGRKDTDRSELITAALDATLPPLSR
ncbi:Uncharacterised protein [Mycobacteroides abscessus subsp. abscessus]|uniref:hypothetical protein n=1 Tax=Mycobacteroides abscessus TaxID=36809 RepID=UPI00092CCABD|nr:hypothetical protein [Mycobacteroides abscessus]SIC06280.1 Uncharacterised protein [Mycobacteroides abscessus subsp. abscessus]